MFLCTDIFPSNYTQGRKNAHTKKHALDTLAEGKTVGTLAQHFITATKNHNPRLYRQHADINRN